MASNPAGGDPELREMLDKLMETVPPGGGMAHESRPTKLAPTGAVERVSMRAINAELRAIADALVDADGELTPEIEQALHDLEGERETKLEGIALLHRNMRLHAEMAAAEEEEIAKIRRMWERAAERLRAYAHNAMRDPALPLVRLKTARVSMWRARNARPSFHVQDARALPEKFRIMPSAPEPVLRDDVTLDAWRAEFDRIVKERTALMSKEERDVWILTNLQRIADEAGRVLPAGVVVTLEEHLRL